jgi:hypothetical protein
VKQSIQQHQHEHCNEQHHPQQQQDNICNTNSPQYNDLGSYLKRVHISMSPGELYLDRDLSELGNHWIYDHWSPTQQILGHLVDFLVDAFWQYYPDSCSSNATIVSEDHEQDNHMQIIVSPIKTNLPLDLLLPPKHFDVGYD